MRSAVISFLIPVAGSLLLLISLDSAVAGERAGEMLARQVHDRPDGEDMTTRSTMVLAEADREPRVRRMITYRIDLASGETRSLIRFTAPEDIADTGLLTFDHPDGRSEQWIYLPALDRSRRIPATRKGGRFVGSDLFYEDLRTRRVELDHHRLMGTEMLFGVETQLLESIPVEPGNSTYGKRLRWIHPDTLLPLRVDFFPPGGGEQPKKRLEVHRIEQVQGYWTVLDTTITDLDSGHSTRLLAEEVRYDRQLPDSLFTSRALEDPERERHYRP